MKYLSILFALLVFASCAKDDLQLEDMLEGVWTPTVLCGFEEYSQIVFYGNRDVIFHYEDGRTVDWSPYSVEEGKLYLLDGLESLYAFDGKTLKATIGDECIPTYTKD